MFLYIKGVCTSPEQWSVLLYGDTKQDLLIENIINNLSTPNLFHRAIQQFTNVLASAGPSCRHLVPLENIFKNLSKITINQAHLDPSTSELLLNLIKELLKALINY